MTAAVMPDIAAVSIETLSHFHYPTVFGQFRDNTTKHVMTVKHEEGLYRHLRFAEPGTGMWHFDLITWPGYLTIVGDIGAGFTFRRDDDMLHFFDHGQPLGHINASYWAEKLVRAGRHQVLEYSEETFVKHVNGLTDMFCEDLDADAAADLRQQVSDDVLANSWNEHEALTALNDFSVNGRRLDDDMDSDSWQDYNHHFLLACHAILWGAKVYAASRP